MRWEGKVGIMGDIGGERGSGGREGEGQMI